MIHAPWLSGLRAVATTGHPSRASLSAIARPMPDEQPVTRTVREIARGAGTSVMGPACIVVERRFTVGLRPR